MLGTGDKESGRSVSHGDAVQPVSRDRERVEFVFV